MVPCDTAATQRQFYVDHSLISPSHCENCELLDSRCEARLAIRYSNPRMRVPRRPRRSGSWPLISLYPNPARGPVRCDSDRAKRSFGRRYPSADLVLQGGGDCLRTLLDNADRYYLTPDQVASTIFVDHGGVSSTDFHLTADQQQMLLRNGRDAGQAYVASHPVG